MVHVLKTKSNGQIGSKGGGIQREKGVAILLAHPMKATQMSIDVASDKYARQWDRMIQLKARKNLSQVVKNVAKMVRVIAATRQANIYSSHHKQPTR